MSALTHATIIVEAGETSGTLTQARAALQQGRRLFIHDACFRREGLTWPEAFARRGATRFTDSSQIRDALKDALAAAPH
jgi:DNA processing protein